MVRRVTKASESLLDELKRYVGFDENDERALRGLHPLAAPHFEAISREFYRRILEHADARTALEGGEQQVGRLKVTLVDWMDTLLRGPWGEEYFERRCRIGRVHVRIALPQHYMFSAMSVIRCEFQDLIVREFPQDVDARLAAHKALAKILDIELAIMLHTYREDLLSQQARQERLATFGQLAGSIGHELRNPLGVIETSLYLLRGRVAEDERTRKHLDRIGEQVHIANDIVTDLLDIIRDRPLTRERLELRGPLLSASGSVQRPDGVGLHLNGLDSVPPVDGDRGQLRQVFVNLLENAVHAAGPQGDVWVDAEASADRVAIAVSDSGPGVDDATRRRLFEPLVTTKAKGIGLGLALVKRICERHGGSISYEPVQGRGARFVVRLPAAVGARA